MTVGRFAGAEMSKFMGSGVKFGEMAQTERSMNSQMNAETSLADSAVAGTGLTTSADVAANKMIKEAEAKLAGAQAQSQGMQSAVGSVMGGLSGLFG